MALNLTTGLLYQPIAYLINNYESNTLSSMREHLIMPTFIFFDNQINEKKSKKTAKRL